MPTYSEIQNSIRAGLALNENDPEYLKKALDEYVIQMAHFSGRDTIVYFANWTSSNIPGNFTSLAEEDLNSFMQAVHGLKNPSLDLILHTPGGSPYAADGIIHYLRQKFKHIRVIVPHAAMSAGTMLACGADSIVLGKHSFLGPLDPQFNLQTALGYRPVPAYAIIQQFEKAQKEILDNAKMLNFWMPILNQFGPALITECENAIEFGKKMVADYLSSYMLSDDPQKAESIAAQLSAHDEFLAHAKHLPPEKLREMGLIIEELEDNDDFQDKVLSVFHACSIISEMASIAKLTTNQNGASHFKVYKPK